MNIKDYLEDYERYYMSKNVQKESSRKSILNKDCNAYANDQIGGKSVLLKELSILKHFSSPPN